MQVLFRGQSTFTEVPDHQPPATSTPVLRSESPATQVTPDHIDTQARTDHASSVLASDFFPSMNATHDAQTAMAPVDTQPVFTNAGSPIQWFAHSDSLPQFLPVASVVTDVSGTVVRGADLGDSGGFGDGGGSVFRGGDTLASLALDSSGYADHGWLIVPSASNEYGDTHVDMAAVDGFAFDMAAGEFTSDWFLV